MVRMPRFETSCLETGVKTLITETVASQHILARSIFHCQFTLIAKIPIAKCPIAKIPIAKCPIDKIPIAECQIAKCPIAKCPIAKKHSSLFNYVLGALFVKILLCTFFQHMEQMLPLVDLIPNFL